MAEPRFGSDDDLPRTLRRAREERDREMREQREREMQERAAAPSFAIGAPPSDVAPPVADVARPPDIAPPLAVAHAGTVRRFEVPFLHLVSFFLKAVLAALPALLLLTVLLWLGGQALKSFFPSLGRMQIKIEFVGGPEAGTQATSAPPPSPAPSAAGPPPRR